MLSYDEILKLNMDVKELIYQALTQSMELSRKVTTLYVTENETPESIHFRAGIILIENKLDIANKFKSAGYNLLITKFGNESQREAMISLKVAEKSALTTLSMIDEMKKELANNTKNS